MKEKYLSKGSIVLFTIALIVTLATALVCNHFDAEKVTIIASSAMAGIVSVMGIGALFESQRLQMPMGPESGFVGIIIGVILNLIIY